ncbi:DUF1593 domain-containing protein [Parabacteroides sp. PF5-9]|uniref:DUF1593 domain-containing protein n=1 Tax=Parabacteroides sp. PF5-9 TaxID=1742404 RepID=UPI002474F49E|nr:DUF1593 domain-containing protein [Parabacteroides sp. PF5-9]
MKRNLIGKLSLMIAGLAMVFSFTSCSQETAPKPEKPRIIITCDPELDDLNSLIRFLLHATDFRIEGLIYASSQYHWSGDGKGTKWFVDGREYTRHGLNMGPMESYRWAKDERFIHEAVEAYEQVYPNLKVHHPDYPTPEYLKSKIRYGNVEFDGDISKDTPGSELIKSVILDDVPGPLFITAWGGGSTIARALKVIQDNNENTPGWPALKKKISDKVILSLSGDQDDTYANYMKPNWPDIAVLQSGGAGVGLAYNVQASVKPEYAYYYEPEWVEENILSKGPMGAMFRVWGDGKQMVEGDIFDYFHLSGYTVDELKAMGYIVWTPPHKKNSWLAEGDTHTFLNLLDNGLRAHEDQNYGGWSGRKRGAPPAGEFGFGRRGRDEAMPDNFLPAAQNELAARFRWSVTPNYEGANHHPVITAPLSLSAKPGEKVNIKATVTDPDKDTVAIKWWPFKVGTYDGDIQIENTSSASTSLVVPNEAKSGETIHLILEAQDNGSPALTRYHRVIITVV